MSKISLHKIYNPITATPLSSCDRYIEISPCEALAPYIRCFWGTTTPVSNLKESGSRLVTPDTCMDIIFNINYTYNKINAKFCGINDSTFQTNSDNQEKIISTFAIRFYAWSVVLFSDDDMKIVKNKYLDVEHYFANFKNEIEPILESTSTLYQRIEFIQKFLLNKINLNRQNNNVMNVVSDILIKKGNVKTSFLAENNQISTRQLQRLFLENIGVSPNLLSSMIRYQYLWNDIVFNNNFDVQEAVLKYGYTDQPHLINDFKKRHSMTPLQAKAYANEFSNVAFLQYNKG